ncbi:MAG: hypothetical protein AAF618_00110 [Pseudomonadota bacterium]
MSTISTTALTPTTALDEVLGNQGGDTRRVAVGQLATQMVSDGPIADAIAANAAPDISDLEARVTTVEGQQAEAAPQYPDEPTGRAAVADGEEFRVDPSSADQAYRVFRRVDANSSIELSPVPSPSALVTLRAESANRVNDETAALASETNLALSGAQTLDGAATSDGMIVLCTGQAIGAENGVYQVSHAGAWSRAATGDTAEKLASLTVFVDGGATLQGSSFRSQTKLSTVLGTDEIRFEKVAKPAASDPLKADKSTVDELAAQLEIAKASAAAPRTTSFIREEDQVPRSYALLPSLPAPEGWKSVEKQNAVFLLSGEGYAGSVYGAAASGQWYADLVAISGETGSTYTLTQENEGKNITCLTASGGGYQAFSPRLEFGFPYHLTGNDLPDGPVTTWTNSNEWPLPFESRNNNPTAASGVVVFGPDADGKDMVSQPDLSNNGQAYDGPPLTLVETYTLPDALGSPGSNGAPGENLGFSIAGITKMPASSPYGWAAANGGLDFDGSSAMRIMSVVFLSEDFSTNMLEIDLTSFRPTYWSTSRSPQDVDYDPDADVIWVLDIDAQRLNSINYADPSPSVQTSVAIPADITSVSIVNQAHLPSLVLPSSVNMTGVTKAAWIMSSGATATFSLIDLTPGSEGTSLHTFDVALQSRQDHIDYCAEDSLLYLTYGTNSSTPSIVVIDPLQGNILARKELSGIIGIEGLHYDRAKDQMIISRNGRFHAGDPDGPNFPLGGISPVTNDARVYDFPVTASRAVDICWVGRLLGDSGFDVLVTLGNSALNQGGYGVGLAADENASPAKGVRISSADEGPQGGIDEARFPSIDLFSDVILYARADADGYTLWVNGTEVGTEPAVNSRGAFGIERLHVCGSSGDRYANAAMRSACFGYHDGRVDRRQAVEGSMAHKHGLVALLPSDHPYKTAGPRSDEVG